MLLKSYLQALLSRFYSKTAGDKKEISALGIPSIIGVVDYGTKVTSPFTAPEDGYVCIGAKNDDAGTTWISSWGSLESTILGDPAGYSAVFLPVLKGRAVFFDASSLRFFKFYKLMGGGLKLISELLFGKFCGEVCHA